LRLVTLEHGQGGTCGGLPLLHEMPVAGYVFVLDGVLIGAGDARYLAIAGGVNLVVYLPLLWWAGGTLAGLWAAFALGYIGVRAVTLGVRAHRRGWVEAALSR